MEALPREGVDDPHHGGEDRVKKQAVQRPPAVRTLECQNVKRRRTGSGKNQTFQDPRANDAGQGLTAGQFRGKYESEHGKRQSPEPAESRRLQFQKRFTDMVH